MKFRCLYLLYMSYLLFVYCVLYVGLDAGDVDIAGHANDGLHGELGDWGTWELYGAPCHVTIAAMI